MNQKNPIPNSQYSSSSVLKNGVASHHQGLRLMIVSRPSSDPEFPNENIIARNPAIAGSIAKMKNAQRRVPMIELILFAHLTEKLMPTEVKKHRRTTDTVIITNGTRKGRTPCRTQRVR